MSLKIDVGLTIKNPPTVKVFGTTIPALATSHAGLWTSAAKYVDPATLIVTPRAGAINLIPPGSGKPTFATDGITGRKVLVFAGGSTNQVLRATGVFDSGSKSIAIGFNTAVESASGASTSIVDAFFDNLTGTDYAFRLMHETNKLAVFDEANSTTLIWPSLPGVGAWHWAIMAIKSNQIALSVDGGDFITAAIGAMTTANNSYNLNIGGRSNTESTYYNGSIETVVADKGYAPDNPAWTAEVNDLMTRLYR